jgi:DNA-binding NtrC family response regulator
MTAWTSVEVAVEAMRRGARDFVQKPWENARLVTILHNQVELRRARRRSERLEAENQVLRGEAGPTLIAESASMRPVLEMIARVGPSDANVLITGENGTGKGLVAARLHAASARADRPLVSVNLGGLPETLFESELFGHVKGAFTDAKADRVGRFEMAEGGTLFLDEIANVPPSQQARLLRVLETGEYERVGSSKTLKADVRFISATNADLRAEVEAGRFRQDLLFRLNTIEIPLPPLRDRREDLPLLAAHFLRQYAAKYRKVVKEFEPAALQLFLDHPWPGNVRELGHVVERAVLMCPAPGVRAADLGLQAPRDGSPRLEDMSMEDVERFLIKKTLARFDGNARKAAEALGLSRSAFYRRLEKYGL